VNISLTRPQQASSVRQLLHFPTSQSFATLFRSLILKKVWNVVIPYARRLLIVRNTSSGYGQVCVEILTRPSPKDQISAKLTRKVFIDRIQCSNHPPSVVVWGQIPV